jgi:hypothetical protein
MLASIHGVALADGDLDELKQRMSTMPAHPDVVPALSRLRDAGFRLVTLTNSASASSPTPLERAGLGGFFEQSFSVESVRKFKPAPETYRLVAEQLGVETSDLCLVACHLWDTIGAQAAGCRGALVTRPHNAILPAADVPIRTLSHQNSPISPIRSFSAGERLTASLMRSNSPRSLQTGPAAAIPSAVSRPVRLARFPRSWPMWSRPAAGPASSGGVSGTALMAYLK